MKKAVLMFLVVSMLFVAASCTDINNETTDKIINENKSGTENDVMTTVPPAQGLESEENFTAEDIPGNNLLSDRCFYGADTGTDKTFTGLEPLKKIDFTLSDMDNSKGKPTQMISHSYGVATEEKPHTISVQNQQFFDEKGYDAVCYDSKTEEKVLYLTFDCGYENGYTAKILDVLKEKNITAAFFCTLPQIRDNHELIARMINEGHIVGNHSVTHPDFSAISRREIINEIKGFDDYIRENFGYSSLYFRYPQGKYSENSLDAVNELGYKCVFWSLAYADWDIENQKGAAYACETVLSRLHPGAVILLHSVSPDNANALADIIDSAVSRGYVFKSLDELS